VQVSALWTGYSRNVESKPVRTKSATSFVGFILVRPRRPCWAAGPRAADILSCMRAVLPTCSAAAPRRALSAWPCAQGDVLAQRLAGEPFHFTRWGCRLDLEAYDRRARCGAARHFTRRHPRKGARLTPACARRCLRLGTYGLLIDGPVGHWWCAPRAYWQMAGTRAAGAGAAACVHLAVLLRAACVACHGAAGVTLHMAQPDGWYRGIFVAPLTRARDPRSSRSAVVQGTGGTTVGATRNRTELFLKYRNQARGATRPIGLPGSSPTSRQAEKCAPLRPHYHRYSGAPRDRVMLPGHAERAVRREERA